MSTRAPVDVAIVGGGVIGLASAWRCAAAGLRVAVVDPEPGQGASNVAAGMLAPVTEVHYGEEALTNLNLSAAARWPSFAAELEAVGGGSVGYERGGTLLVALDADDDAVVADLVRYQLELGLAVQRLRGSECRALEAGLAPSTRGGALAEGDDRVDPRALVDALLVAADTTGVDVVRERVTSITVDADVVHGVTLASGDQIRAGTVVLAGGSWSAGIDGLPAHARPPVRPVKGQILTLRGRAEDAPLTRAVRGIVHGAGVYLVPRADGRVVVGATVEERGWDTRVTAGGVYELLRDAVAIVPGIDDMELTECRAGLRPGSPDNAPMIGRGTLAGLVIATGHHRNGVLLTPVTADAVAMLCATGSLPDGMAPFDPARFDYRGADTTAGARR